ncbi:MAG: DUF6941 family protein [Planctomycetota bacterium]
MVSDAKRPSKVTPTLLAVLLCDAGVTDRATQKKTLVGLFAAINTIAFPVIRPVTFYMRVTDGEGYYPLRVEFWNAAADEVLGTANGEVTLPDRHAIGEVLFDFPPLPFERPGVYEFRIFMSDMYIGAATLRVINLQAGEQDG